MNKYRSSLWILALILLMASCNEEAPKQSEECDSTNVTYSNDIAPIIQQNCLTCHTTSIKSGGVWLDSYEGVKKATEQGKLLESVRHSGDYPMPPSYKLSPCYITKISSWIEEGAKNN